MARKPKKRAGIKGEAKVLDKGALKRVQQICGGRIQEFGEGVVERARDIVAIDTGNLKRSIKATKLGELSLKVETRCGYGAYVELGTKRMAARPFLAPAADATIAEFEKSGPWA
jgi:HK97 gp10 family phage protein